MKATTMSERSVRAQYSILKEWIREGEHEHQDFKFEISDTYKIAKTLSAFANTHGGRLLIGVKDNGKIAGVQSQEEAYMIKAAAERCCIGEVELEMTSLREDGKTVLIAEIKESSNKPVLAKTLEGENWAYVRIKDENILASPVHMAAWRQESAESAGILTFTQSEEEILRAIEQSKEGLTLSQVCRQSCLPRRKVIQLLARLMRYGTVDIQHTGSGFVFKGNP